VAIDDQAAAMGGAPAPGNQRGDDRRSDDDNYVGPLVPKHSPHPDSVDEVTNRKQNLLRRPAAKVRRAPAELVGDGLGAALMMVERDGHDLEWTVRHQRCRLRQ
jgi:hypothetical protein